MLDIYDTSSEKSGTSKGCVLQLHVKTSSIECKLQSCHSSSCSNTTSSSIVNALPRRALSASRCHVGT